jgi:hypothetical protein
MLQGATVPKHPEACQNTNMWMLRKYEVHKQNNYTMYYISPERSQRGDSGSSNYITYIKSERLGIVPGT